MLQESNTSTEDQWAARFLRGFSLFWTAVVYVVIAMGLYHLATAHGGELQSASGLLLLLGIAAFLTVYHLVFVPGGVSAPKTPRRALLYFGMQTPLLAFLMSYGTFFGLGIALLAHAIVGLPPRWWPLPILAILVVMGTSPDVAGDIREDGLDALFDIVFTVALWIAVFIMFRVSMYQYAHLRATVAQLRHAQEELRRSAVQAEELAALRERTRLAREMHDSLGHSLVAVNVKLEAAQRLYKVDPRRGDAELEQTRGLVRQAMTELRRSLADMRDPQHPSADLPSALGHLAAETRARSGIQVSIEVDDDLGPVAQRVSEALSRVTREALANVERHSGAADAAVTLSEAGGCLELVVRDNGRGLSPADLTRPGHYGVTGMRERVEELDGDLDVGPGPEGGTVVRARVPLHVQSRTARAEEMRA